jgi:pimeloyl-ACP methyl ester carboxylesterase
VLLQKKAFDTSPQCYSSKDIMAAVNLSAQVIGEGEPLVILHGLFGSARNWGSIARGLADIRQVHALDLRNHGAVNRLIIVDIAPVPYVRENYPEYLHAMQAVNLEHAHRRADIDATLAPVIPDPTLRAFLMQNLVSEQGRFHWRINLAGIAANLAAIVAFPDSPDHFGGPTTFLAGERSNYIRPRDRDAIDRLFPQAKMIEIGQAGHWPHAEQPERFLALVRNALMT